MSAIRSILRFVLSSNSFLTSKKNTYCSKIEFMNTIKRQKYDSYCLMFSMNMKGSWFHGSVGWDMTYKHTHIILTAVGPFLKRKSLKTAYHNSTTFHIRHSVSIYRYNTGYQLSEFHVKSGAIEGNQNTFELLLTDKCFALGILSILHHLVLQQSMARQRHAETASTYLIRPVNGTCQLLVSSQSTSWLINFAY